VELVNAGLFPPSAALTLVDPMTPFGRWFRLLFLASCAAIGVTAAELPKGQVLEKVTCASDATQTYALYIPTTFDAGRHWPLLMCFDPGAHGVTPVERFKAGAEKYGYIVVGSNNSRNGPWEANAAAITAMFRDVDRFLPIDGKRVYAAGLSGGARVACQIALAGVVKGVVACSAAFAGGETPDGIKFPVFGTAGITDFNYLELRRVDRDMDERRLPHRVVFHGGGHEWLSVELATEALAWLDLQAIRTGAKPKDPVWVEAEFTARRAAIPAQPITERYRGLHGLVADFKGLTATGDVEKEFAALNASKEWRDTAKAERALERREESITANLMESVAGGFTNSVRKTATELRAKADAKDTAEGQMAFRALQACYSACGETSREMMRHEAYGEAEPLLEMMTIMRPERPQAFFDFARCAAQRGDQKRALAALQQAVGAGFKDATRVENEKVFAALRREPAFLDLLSAMR
jgi:poly(3-hydroxybutyrate) depolymerase